ncbi:MAG: amino acid adenylation domain-containing protein, partial [Opitutaceae bacterium]
MILEGIASAPDAPLLELPLLTEAERKQILEDWNATAAAFPADATLPELIRIKAAETPDAIALSCAGREMTYRELVAQAARLASQLRERGIRPEARAGVCMDRSLAMVVALLGILEAGGAYVPLDPAHPKDRLDFMIADAGITLVLCDATGRTALGAATAPLLDVNLDSPSPPPVSAVSAPGGTSANLAYVIYTSGSTGRPKGVPIEHRALVNFLCSTQRYPGIEPGDRLLAITTLSFDVAGLELWLPLIAGACVIIGSRDLAFDSPGLIHVLESERITMMQATPAIWRLLVESGWQGNPRLRVFSGGEALAPDLARELLPRCAELWNLYGPTETTIYSTLARITETDPIHIGRPAGNTDAYILNARLQPAPAGVPGELFLGGEGLARGYINRPELAAEKFIAHPLRPGRRLYRTGDLARWRADGNIEYMGRLDHQIKIHGHRIEPGELESVLREHPGIDAAIVVAREDTPGDKRLVAYIECRGGVAPNLRELREHLRKRVPEYMLPAACVRLARLPLTANNKIDRNALPAPQIPEDFESVEHARPRNAIEDRLAQIWADVLRLPRVGIHDDFFELGGDSMLVIRTLARARDAGLSFTARQVFQHPTIAQLAASHAKQDPRGIGGPASVWTASGTDDTEVVPPANPSRSELRDIGPKVNERSTSSKRRLLEMKLRKRGQEAQGEGRATRSGDSSTIPDHATSTIQRAPRDRPLRASFAQEQMSLLDQMEPDRPVYNVAWLYRLRGPLDAAAFEAAFGEIIRRHETLRTSIDWSGAEAIQVIQPFAGFHIAVTDLSRLETDKGIAEMRRLALQHTYEPFDPEREVLLRARLFRLGSDDHALLIGQHHIATDAWSWANLWSELTALYDAFRQGKPSPLPPLAIRYADFAHWQRAQLDAGRLESLLRFWRAEVGGASAVQLPTDRRRPPQPSYAGATIGFLLPRELVRDLEACARREHATLFMIMLAAFNVLQHRLSGQDEFIVGTAVAGRAVPATEPLIGCFINMLALRADLRGEPTFRELLQRVRDRMLAAFEHEQLPIDRLVADRRVKDPRSGLVYETALVAHNTPPPIPRLADLAIETLPKPEALARLDLLVTMEPREAGMELLVEYRTDLFDESTVRRWMQHFEILLRAATTTPDERIGRLPLLSPAEREEMLVAWNATAEPMPPAASLHALFTAQAARTPDATAIVSAGGNLTYRELDAQSRRLAVRLRALGVGPEKIVGLCVDRSPQMIAGILGILRAGGAYLPLDPEMPATRVATILEDAQAFALVTRGHLEPDLPPFSGPVVRIDEDIPSSEIVPKLSNDGARPENLAYVIYTSGSTGAHKGVLIEHRSAVNCTLAASRKFTLGPGDRLLQFASISFDTSVEEIFTTLASGAT